MQSHWLYLQIQKMHQEAGRDYFMLHNEPCLTNRREGVKRRNQRHFFKSSNENTNKSQKQYFPDHSNRRDVDYTSLNKSSKSFNHSPLVYRRLTSEVSKGMTINSSRRTMKSYQSDLEKEIDRLNSEIQQRDRQLMNKNAKKADEKIKQSEIVELYRIINYYEGKLKGMQMDIKVYEEKLFRIGKQCDQKSQHKTAVTELVQMFQDFRKKNDELCGEIQEKNYEIGSLRDKLKKIEFKYFNLTQNKGLERKKPRKFQIKKEKSQLTKKKFFASTNLKERMEQYGNVQSKINLIQSNLQFLKKENEKLEKEVMEKEDRIEQLEDEIIQVRGQNKQIKNNSNLCDQSNKKTVVRNSRAIKGQEEVLRDQRKITDKTYDKSDPLNQVMTLPKAFVREIKKPEAKIEEKDYSFQIQIKSEIFRKLKYNLLTQSTSYEELLHILADEEFDKQKLEEDPFNLTEDEAGWVAGYLTRLWEKVRERESEENVGLKVKEQLKRKIPYFKNITLRKQKSIETQIANDFANREEEFLKMYENQKEVKISSEEMMNYFKNWGFSTGQLDYLGKTSYQSLGHCSFVDLSVIKNAFIKQEDN